MQSHYLVVNSIIKILDEDVALAGLAQGWVALGPHNTAGTALDKGIVELLQSALTYSTVLGR